MPLLGSMHAGLPVTKDARGSLCRSSCRSGTVPTTGDDAWLQSCSSPLSLHGTRMLTRRAREEAAAET